MSNLATKNLALEARRVHFRNNNLQRMRTMVKLKWNLCLLLVRCVLIEVNSQSGVNLCACQPSVYTFKFNFTAICNIQTILRPGIRGADCFAREFTIGQPVNDTVPVQVNTVTVLELDRQLRVIAQTPYRDDFRDGETFVYTSIAGTPEGVSMLSPDRWPGGIQLDIVGINQNEEPITNVWIILFDNDCGIYPVLQVGDVIGWTILHDLQLPLQSVCPRALQPTGTSTLFPSLVPTGAPSTIRSTNIPIIAPSFQPAVPATMEPTACIPRHPVSGKGKSGKGKDGNDKGGKGLSTSTFGKGYNSMQQSGKASSENDRNEVVSKYMTDDAVDRNESYEEKLGEETEGDDKDGKYSDKDSFKTSNTRNESKRGGGMSKRRKLQSGSHPYYGNSLTAEIRGVGNRPNIPFCPENPPKKKDKYKDKRPKKLLKKEEGKSGKGKGKAGMSSGNGSTGQENFGKGVSGKAGNLKESKGAPTGKGSKGKAKKSQISDPKIKKRDKSISDKNHSKLQPIKNQSSSPKLSKPSTLQFAAPTPTNTTPTNTKLSTVTLRESSPEKTQVQEKIGIGALSNSDSIDSESAVIERLQRHFENIGSHPNWIRKNENERRHLRQDTAGRSLGNFLVHD